MGTNLDLALASSNGLNQNIFVVDKIYQLNKKREAVVSHKIVFRQKTRAIRKKKRLK